MPSFLLHLEAVNFDSSCYDTNDISTIRGGSMMSADAHDIARDSFPAALIHPPLSHGASHAIWTFEAADETAAEGVRTATLRALANHPLLKHGTFVASVVPHVDGGAAEVHRLRTLSRWSQLQQPTVTAPDRGGHQALKTASPYCEFDRVRPAVTTAQKGRDSYRVSSSTFDRRDYGKRQKTKFFQGLTGEAIDVVHDLRELTDHPDGEGHRLHGKMAVLYIDGNQQSEMAARLGARELRDFRAYVRDQHEEFLKRLLGEIQRSRPTDGESGPWHFWDRKSNRHQIRLETLVWGGDDILLIVPAWQAWWTVRQFYAAARTWTFNDAPFTHATGVVFCHYKAPVQNMREFAGELLVQAKKDLRDGRYQDRIAYEVLESFDVIPPDLAKFHRERLAIDFHSAVDPLLLSPEQLPLVEVLVQAVKQAVAAPDAEVSRRQIERRARAMPTQPVDQAFDAEAAAYLRAVAPFAALPLPTRPKLFHLTALWDYIA